MKVNGIELPLAKEMTLLAFLESQGYNVAKVAVERNGRLSPKSGFAEVYLQPEDILEVVSFVGGG